MVFLSDSRFGELGPVPDNLSICDFMLDEKNGRVPHSESKDPYTCGITGQTYSSQQVVERVDQIARGLSKEFGWSPNQGTEWDKTLAVFSVNTVSKCAGRLVPAAPIPTLKT